MSRRTRALVSAAVAVVVLASAVAIMFAFRRLPVTTETQGLQSRAVTTQSPYSDHGVGVVDEELGDLDVLIEQSKPVVDSERDLDARRQVPVHPWHAERLENIANETLEDTAKNLAHFDDVLLVEASIPGATPCSLDFHVQAVTRLVRVRRLLEAARADPSRVTPLLEHLLAEAVEGYNEAYAAFAKVYETEGPPVKTVNDEPWLYSTYEWRALGATYLLAELQDHDALPILARSYSTQDFPLRRSPVQQGVTLYAMHKLVRSFPEERLSAEARRLRSEYLDAARILPEPEERLVSSWSAEYAESDLRVVIFDQEGRVLKGQAQMKISIWPSRLIDGSEIGDYRCACPQAAALFAKLEAFIEAAFPGAYSPSDTPTGEAK